MRLASLLLVLSTVTPALADDSLVATRPAKTLAIDGVAVLPLGDYADAASLGAGAFVRLEVPLGTGFLIGRVGVIGHSVNQMAVTSLTLVPVLVGYRQPVGTGGAYVAGELGITFGYATADTRFGNLSDTDSELGFMLGAGWRRGPLDLRASLFAPDADDVHGFMASLGYDFASL
ncbi:MAG: hypothetical protein H0V17_33490 [Deltaproteobacteria bacterium]|nr:hypothetical protein [Deltaproteobacteria bacterium]